MENPKFVHLSLHSAYSLAEGAIHIKDLADWALNNNMPAVALTDTNNLFGALEFSETLKEEGIQPIVGCTLSLSTRYFKAGPQGGRIPSHKIRLLAKDQAGYKNLLKIVSDAHLKAAPGDDPHRALEDLKGLTGGLILLTGGAEGPLGALVLDGRLPEAAALLDDLTVLFRDRLYIEILRHGLEAEKDTEEAFLDLAYAKNIPIVATNEAYFIKEDMYSAHDALLCIADGTYVAEVERRRVTPEHRLKSADQMCALFADLPEALENTVLIAKRCSFSPSSRDPILPNFITGSGASEADLLKTDAEKGLQRRLESQGLEAGTSPGKSEKAAQPYRQRLSFELEVITKMGFAGYFLIVADFIQWAKDHGVPVGPGRGSGAGSVVAWALGITELDPLRFGLLFERFLNPDRVSMADFDIDFCQEKRDQVISYVQDKYGHGHVAQIITFGSMNARGVMRDVGRVLQQPYPVTDRLCKMIPNNPANPTTLAQALKMEPRFAKEREQDELTAAVIARALKLEGLYRHASTHAAGVVIGDRPLDQLIPLYRDPRSDMPVTGFSMKWVEKAGLVKFDFLGLKTLTVLSQAIKFIKKSGREVSLEDIPLDDTPTYRLIARGDTAGVFQLEGSGMRASLKALKPDKFEDIIAMVALYRPGPMDNIPAYINRKHGREPEDYLHEWLEPVLKETHGVIIYQEQVMEIAKILAGYSLGEADLLRRAMGKKIQSEMDAQRKRFVEGAKAKGVDGAKASGIFDLVAKFAGYGFNKSHAAAYALIAYQTAYLKAHYPVEFLAATMCLERDNTDKLAHFVKEVRRMKIPLYSPDMNASEANFIVEGEGGDKGIRYALAAVKNVGAKAMEGIVAERRQGGPFKDVFELMERVDPAQLNKRQVENLVMAGAFDSLNADRAQTFASLGMLLKHAHACQEARHSAQENLFAGEGESPVPRLDLAQAESWDQVETLKREREALGFYFSSHPLESYGEVLARRGVLSSHQVMSSPALIGKTIKMAGIMEDLQIRKAAKTGKPYAFLTLSDMAGSYEALVFGETLEQIRDDVNADAPLLVTVSVDQGENDGSIRLVVRGVEPFDPEALIRGAVLHVTLSNAGALAGLSEAIAAHPGGEGRITLIIRPSEAREVEISLEQTLEVTPALQAMVKSLPGVAETRITYR
ncbi:MAG: DNA polymerase III subunit alpha [Proteobacteria bacterium]|nr:DNA polymerase III subunit alpha [Pseudomonadota bacterium]